MVTTSEWGQRWGTPGLSAEEVTEGVTGGEGWAVCPSWTAEVGHKPQVGDVIELSQRTKLVQAGSWSVLVLLSKEQTRRWNEKSKQLGGRCLWRMRGKREERELAGKSLRSDPGPAPMKGEGEGGRTGWGGRAADCRVASC